MSSHLVFTIGHSTHSLDSFLVSLGKHAVNAVADVRSAPYSRFNPVFNRESLKKELNTRGIYYVFLGDELGGRPSDPTCYQNGRADYLKMAATEPFREGIERVLEGSHNHRIALMCSEGDPLDCHRTLLVARALAQRGVSVAHILRNGDLQSHNDAEDRMIHSTGLSTDLLRTREDALIDAYALQASRVAYVEPSAASLAGKAK